MKILVSYNGVFLYKETPFNGDPCTFCIWPRVVGKDKELEEWVDKLAEFTGWEITHTVAGRTRK